MISISSTLLFILIEVILEEYRNNKELKIQCPETFILARDKRTSSDKNCDFI